MRYFMDTWKMGKDKEGQLFVQVLTAYFKTGIVYGRSSLDINLFGKIRKAPFYCSSRSVPAGAASAFGGKIDQSPYDSGNHAKKDTKSQIHAAWLFILMYRVTLLG